MKLMYFVIQDSVYAILEDLRNQDNTGLTSSEIELFVLGKRTVIQSHCTSSNMHFSNATRQLRPMSIKEIHHVTEKAGLKSTSGQIGSDRDIVDQ